MEVGLIVAMCSCTVATVGSILAMMFWVRSETNDLRKELININKSMASDMKDFHDRLLKIEVERNRILIGHK